MFDFEEVNEAIKKNEITSSQTDGMTVGQAAMFFSHKLDLTPLINQATNHVIVDEKSASQALSMSLQARKIKKQLDEMRMEIVRPHLDFQKSINKIAKDYETKLEHIEENLKTKLDEYLKHAKSTNNASYMVIERGMTVEDGTLKTVRKWSWELEDFNLIPRDYLCLDEKKISEAVKQGIRNISGIKIFEKEEITLRVKN